MTDTRRWDVQLDIQPDAEERGDADIRRHVRVAITGLIGQLTSSGIQCTITAFDGDGDAFDTWDNVAETQ